MPRFNKQSRRGSAYIIVMGASMLIATFMMASLLATNVQRRAVANAADVYQARLNAESGLDMALFYLRENESTWRTNPPTSIPSGTEFQLTFEDPVDNVMADAPFDPLVVTAKGTSGSASQVLRAKLTADALGYECLRSAFHSGDDFKFDGATITSDQLISYDDTFTALNSTKVHASVAGRTTASVDGSSSILGTTTTSGTWPLNMPIRDGIDPITLYVNQAVPISVYNLWHSNHYLNRLANSDFDDGMVGWIAEECTVELQSYDTALIRDRQTEQSGLAQNLTDQVYSDGIYKLACWIFNPNTQQIQARVTLRVESSIEGVQQFATAYVDCQPSVWTYVQATVTPQWTGVLSSGTWQVSAKYSEGGAEFLGPDDGVAFPPFKVWSPSINDRSYPDDSYVFRHKLLSPVDNPFSGTTDSEGIYHLNCQDEVVFIEDVRIVGTLVLTNSNNVTIRRRVNMRNFVYNYPVLLAKPDVKLELSSDPLSEVRSRVNFDFVGPTFSPTANPAMTDSYDCRVDGLIYVNDDLRINGPLTTRGAILVYDDVFVTSAALHLTHNKVFYEDPPPGFVESIDMVQQPGTLRAALSN